MTLRTLGKAATLWLVFLGLLRAADHYVVPPGTGGVTPGGAYTTWATAATNIQQAVDVAVPGETVWVSNGIYRVTNQVTISSSILVRSLSGWTNTLVYANWPAYTTRVFSVANAGIIDGFAISNGHYMMSNSYAGGGGAYLADGAEARNCLFCYNVCSNTAMPTGGGGAYATNALITNCTFYANVFIGHIDAGGGDVGGGAGAFLDNAVIAGSVISSNRSQGQWANGGGLYLKNAQAYGCSVISNWVSFSGGGIYSTGPKCLVSNCIISANTGGYAGGMAVGIGGTPGGKITDSIISDNTGLGQNSNNGGGLNIFAGGTAANCTVINNISLMAGGGIACSYNTIVSNCTVAGNRADGRGGGIFAAGNAAGDAEISYCRISNNISAATGGGGLMVTNTRVTVLNSLICNNTNSDAAANGGGIVLWNSAGATLLKMINCTVVGNYSASEGGGAAMLGSGAGGTNNLAINCIFSGNSSASGIYPDIYASGANTNNFWFTCANVALPGGRGNMTNEPFCTASGFRLATNSPCIDTGTNYSWTAAARDLDGLQRIVNAQVDMGAYEAPYIYYMRPPSPVVFSNTVFKGTSTNLYLEMTNTSSDVDISWRAFCTSAWAFVSPAAGVISPHSSVNVVVTNSALVLSPGAYQGRMTIWPTGMALAASCYPDFGWTGVVDMALNVAELTRSTILVQKTVRQGSGTSETVQVWNSGAGEVSYSAGSNVFWLNAVPAGGVVTGQTADATNDVVILFTNTHLLPVGTHYGALTLVPTAGGVAGAPLDINAELTVVSGPQMAVAPLSVTDTVMMGQNPTGHVLVVSNVSTGDAIGFTVATNAWWISVTPAGGELAAGESANLVVNYNASTLTTGASAPSNYQASIRVEATNGGVLGSPATVAVSLTVNPRAKMSLSRLLLTNSVTVGYDAGPVTFEVWNGNGYYTLGYDISEQADWIMATPSSGTSVGGHNTITVEFSTAGLPVGVARAYIDVTGRSYSGTNFLPALDATQTVEVALTVKPTAGLASDVPGSCQFAARLGRAAGTLNFRVWNDKREGSILQYTIATNVGWLSVRPSAGTCAENTDTITLTCNSAGLTPGRHSGAITISGTDRDTGLKADNSPVDVAVELMIYGDKGFNFGGTDDGASDLVVYRSTTGAWSIRNLASGFTTNTAFGGPGYTPVPGDFDGDGATDLGLYRNTSGYWYARHLQDDYLTTFGGAYWAGPELVSDGALVPVAGDYDGDGRTDPAMYCALTALWSALFSGSGYRYVSGTFGGPGFTAAPADYDGDALMDPAVYNESTAEWYVLYSAGGYQLATGVFGGPGYMPASADFDGDGLADHALYNESTGLWVVLPSTTLTPNGYSAVSGVLGGPGFIAVPADYNGDGFADGCVYDTASGCWYIVTLNGTRVAWGVQHGGYGFLPVKP